MDRGVWQIGLSESGCPPWPCPTCGHGVVALAPGAIRKQENAESQREHAHDYWEPEWIEYVFSAVGECTYPPCKETFAISGSGKVVEDFDPRDGAMYSDYFTPRFCVPMPAVIRIPLDCSDDVKLALAEAFPLLWTSPSACAGRIRVALERLMDQLHVATHTIGDGGKRRRMTLHARIKELGQTEAGVAAQLMGVKWLGNAGSHDNQVSMDALLDGLEVLEHALSQLVDKPDDKVSKLAQGLVDRFSGES
jgi:hypothetical protein